MYIDDERLDRTEETVLSVRNIEDDVRFYRRCFNSITEHYIGCTCHRINRVCGYCIASSAAYDKTLAHIKKTKAIVHMDVSTAADLFGIEFCEEAQGFYNAKSGSLSHWR
jgi:hypothetical protein